MDDPALAIGDDLAEHAFYLHPDLRLGRIADDLRRDLRTFVKLHNRKHVGGQHRVRLGRCVDHGERDNRAGPGELVLDNLPCPAAVRTERPWREKVPAARLAFRSHHIVPLREMSPESCNRHLIPSRGCGMRLSHRSRPRCASCRSLRRQPAASLLRHGAAGRSRRPA